MHFWNNSTARPLIGFNASKREKAVINTNTTRRTPTQATQHAGHELISSDKIDGTTVFDTKGDKLGTVRNLMIDKHSGEVRNVIVGYGGLFGMGENNYPMPWKALRYDRDKDGYVMQVGRDKLDPKKAPSFPRDQEPQWDATFERQVTSYYYPTA